MIYYIEIVFAIFAVFNIAMRFTVLKMYNEVRRKGIEVSSKLLFNEKALRNYCQKQYPEDSDKILRFVKYTKFAMTFATILLFLIMILGLILFRSK